ncbi:MAG: hypothetical protein IIX47_07515 [Spirochaetaceae bacterium]|nr:hypothetical protein [Spirochaetaceae bacterium]
MISRDELRSLKAKLLTYCSENDLFDDYNVEGIFDIVAERFMTSDFETLEKEINEVIPKRKFQKFKNMTYNNRIIKDLEDIKEYNELLKDFYNKCSIKELKELLKDAELKIEKDLDKDALVSLALNEYKMTILITLDCHHNVYKILFEPDFPWYCFPYLHLPCFYVKHFNT